MSKITAIVAFPFVMLFVYYLMAFIWSVVVGIATWDLSAVLLILQFWTASDNTGIVLARAFSWVIAFGAGCSVFFME